ncbi:MAG: efflux RND transporter periplasmic adaptor subunit [Rhodobacteraceae bacterium]|nr:efflux RND transporter periplasmic adaptor subunit [Paracoccaceae bacterium]
MKKRIFIVVVLLAVLAAGIVGFDRFRGRMIADFFANRQIPPVTAPVYEVKPLDWTPVVSAIGTVDALNGVELTVEAAGIIKDLNFAANDAVKKDTLLVRLDDAVQEADLEAQRTQARLDQQALERTRELQGRGIRSGVSLDEAEAQAETSKAQVAKLQAVLETKRVYAPFDGTIGIPRVDAGSYVAPGTTIATLQDLETLYVDFKVPEQQLGLLSIGQAVRVRAEEDATALKGRITGIDPKIDSATRLGPVRAEVAAGDSAGNGNSAKPLIPGQFVQVEVQLAMQTGVLAVPQTAVVTSLYGDHVFVVRAADDDADKLVARQAFVTVGRRSGEMVEIVKGLKAGDRVVIAGQNRLSNGTPVKPDNSVAPLDAGADSE